MTEESDSDGEEVKQHKLRGTLKVKISSLHNYNYYVINNLELNSLIQKLDKLQEGDFRKGGFKQKPRKQSTPSLSFPPENASKWAVKHGRQEQTEPSIDSIPVTHTNSHTGSVAADFVDQLSSFSDDSD